MLLAFPHINTLASCNGEVCHESSSPSREKHLPLLILVLFLELMLQFPVLIVRNVLTLCGCLHFSFSESDHIPSVYQENIRVSFVAYTAALRFIEGIFWSCLMLIYSVIM